MKMRNHLQGASWSRRIGPGLLALLLLLLSHAVEAAFVEEDWGARPVGMGGAFTAIADDASAPLYNPAGIVQVQWNEMSAMYSQLFSGLTLYSGNQTTGGDITHLGQTYLSYVSRPSRIGSFGISYANFNATHLYHEDTVALTYAKYLGDLFPALDSAWAVGANAKYLRHAFTLDANTVNDPVFQSGSSAWAATVDAGILWKPEEGQFEGWRVGLTGQNLTSPNVGLQSTDRVPAEGRLGFAYQSKQRPWLVPALDLTTRDGVIGVNGGLESWLFHDTLGLRAGANNNEGSAGISYYQPLSKKTGFRLDYSFTAPFSVEGTAGSHRLQMTVYF
jgi:hypothetical protein